MAEKSEPFILSAPQMAKRLGIGVSRLLTMCRRGEIPYLPKGPSRGRIEFIPSEVERRLKLTQKHAVQAWEGKGS